MNRNIKIDRNAQQPSEMVLDSSLKMSNTTEQDMTSLTILTEKRIKELTMDDLKDIFSAIKPKEAEHIVTAIQKGEYKRVGYIIEMVAYQLMQSKVVGGLRDD